MNKNELDQTDYQIKGILHSIIALCVGGLIFAIFNYIAPLYAEYESADVKSCGQYEPYRGVDNVLLCKCSDNEKQVPGKCGSKYK